MNRNQTSHAISERNVMTALRKPAEYTDDAAEQRIVLYSVDWDSYEKLLEGLQRHPGTRLTYNEGTLEIMVVSFAHEKLSRLICRFICLICEEWEKDYVDGGSTTFKLKKKDRGFEPDGCFYFRAIKKLKNKDRIDLTTDPAPDLAVEVDISSPSISRFPIFARLGVQEVWRWHEGRLDIYQLRGATFVRRETSKFLKGIKAEAITGLIDSSRKLSAPAWQRQVIDYAQRIPGK
jgi:Uma2 family endonuclease